MPFKLVVLLVVVALFFLIFVWRNVIKRKMVINYALLWIVFGIAMAIAVLIPNVLEVICDIIGIATVSNFIFLLGFGLLLMITFVLTEVVSNQKTKITTLAQEVAILKHNERKTK